jgi:hypothetical protein
MPNQIRNSIAEVTEGVGITPKKLVQFTSTPESIHFCFHGGGIVRSSVCENNRRFESALTVTRPDMRMLNAARGHPQPVAHHENYCRESPAPDTCPRRWRLFGRFIRLFDANPTLHFPESDTALSTGEDKGE